MKRTQIGLVISLVVLACTGCHHRSHIAPTCTRVACSEPTCGLRECTPCRGEAIWNEYQTQTNSPGGDYPTEANIVRTPQPQPAMRDRNDIPAKDSSALQRPALINAPISSKPIPKEPSLAEQQEPAPMERATEMDAVQQDAPGKVLPSPENVIPQRQSPTPRNAIPSLDRSSALDDFPSAPTFQYNPMYVADSVRPGDQQLSLTAPVETASQTDMYPSRWIILSRAATDSNLVR